MSPVAMENDGLGAAPPEEEAPPPDEVQPRQDVRVKRKKMTASPDDATAAGKYRDARGKDQFEMEQAADEADDQRLKRKLMICTDCMPAKSARDDAMMSGSSR
jgi:hypothetical protein